MTAGTKPPKRSGKARAKTRAASVVQQAGAEGHVAPKVTRLPYRTDIVPPLLSFVVYGIPSPQGSKEFAGYRGGKPILKESNDGLGPWRDAVRRMSHKAIDAWAKETGRSWVALDEAVMISAVITRPATDAATKRGDIYVLDTPDLDKMERAIGDALAPTPVAPSVGRGMSETMRRQLRDKTLAQRRTRAVLHDDSRIAVWDHVTKVYPSTTVDSLGYSGATIQVWRMSDLEAARRRPVIVEDGATWMQAVDLRTWARPTTGQTWDEAAADLWADPQTILASLGQPVALRGQGIGHEGMRTVLATLALRSPQARIRVEDAPRPAA